MRFFRTAGWMVLLVALVGGAGMAAPAFAQTAADKASVAHALTLNGKGDVTGALAEVEQVLTRAPGDAGALFNAARFNFQLNHLDAARLRLEQLVATRKTSPVVWEFMVQVAQAQGDLKRRDEAIDRLKFSIRGATDPAIKNREFFYRDRIVIGDRRVVTVDYFGRGGTDFTRYQFSLLGPGYNPAVGMLLRTDTRTTENWAAVSLTPPDKPLFHLDMLSPREGGGQNVAIYQYYVGEPDYDTVRATMMRILRGEVQPVSGTPGSMAGILKP